MLLTLFQIHSCLLSLILDPWVVNLFGRIKGHSNGNLLTLRAKVYQLVELIGKLFSYHLVFFTN